MESAKAEQQVTAEQISLAIGVESERRGGPLVRVLWRIVGIALLAVVAALTVRAEIWLLSKDSRILAITGLLFFGYIFLVCAFGIYFYFFSHNAKPRQSTTGH